MSNPSVVERRGALAAVARGLGSIGSALVVRPLLLGALLALGVFAIDLSARVALAESGTGLAPVILGAVVAVPIHVASNAKRLRKDALERVLHLSRRDQRLVVQAVRRGEDVGRDDLAPAVLAYVVAERSGEVEQPRQQRWTVGLVTAAGFGLLVWWSVVELASPARWLFPPAVAALVWGMWRGRVACDRRRERRREEAVALARPRAERHWDARDKRWRQGPGRRATDVLDRGPVPVPRFGGWSDQPLWSLGLEDPHDPASS